MSQLSDYLLGQVLHKLNSIESEQQEHGEKIESLTEKVNEALTWAQRLALMALALICSVGLNLSPEKAGEAVAQILKALR